MNKKIRLFFISLAVLLISIFLIAGGYIYNLKKSNQKVQNPIAKQPQSLELVKELKAASFKIESSLFENQNTIIASVSGSKVVFSKTKSIKTQVKSLQLLLDSLKMDMAKPNEIDLRFDKVIVRFDGKR